MDDDFDQLWRRILDDIRRHQGADGASDALAVGDLHLLESVRLWISAGAINVSRGNQKYFDLLESLFPIGFNRIDWRGVQPHEMVDLLDSQDRVAIRAADEQAHLEGARTLVELWLSHSGTREEDALLWIGDDSDLVLEMTRSVFLECFPRLFGSGQHSYVIPRGCEWCLNYTIEGQLFWGRSSDSLTTGSVDVDLR